MGRDESRLTSANLARYARRLDRRVFFLFVLFLLIFLVVSWKLLVLQILNHRFYSALASDQYEISKVLFPERGEIFLQDSLLAQDKRYVRENLHTVATNRRYWQIYVKPYEILDPLAVAPQFTDLFFPLSEVQARFQRERKEQMQKNAESSLSEEDFINAEKSSFQKMIFDRLIKKNDPYEPIARKVSDETKKTVVSWKLPGVYFAPETYRYYPEKNLGSHVVGFVNALEEGTEGRYGIEFSFERELAGNRGYAKSERDTKGRLITLGESDFQPAVNGSHIVLTIDYPLEEFACQRLADAVVKYEADSGSVIIMNPMSGHILTLCGEPDFDPNEYAKAANISYFNNPAIFLPYEPGSVFKPITMSAGIDLSLIEPHTVYNDPGRVVVGGFPISNYDGRSHGRKDMIEVLIESLNTGTMFVIDKIGKLSFKEYVQRFGFGEKTGVDLPAEQSGTVVSLEEPGMIYAYTASFGQGITVTPLQLASAYSALVNGGILVKPLIVDRLLLPDGGEKKSEPVQIRQIVSKRTSTLISGMLVSAVEKGHARLAQVPGYYIGGKTGTAEVAEAGGYSEQTIHSFVGFGTVNNPIFVMVVRLDHPKKGKFAESTAVPLFGEIAKFLLNYYQIPPERAIDEKK